MTNPVSRRDFLKLAAFTSLSLSIPPLAGKTGKFSSLQEGQPNVIIVVFDALSAYHMSLYGYSRETMPRLSRLAERAVVYYNHFAGGNFTVPGTASLLTGTYPWTHRAFRFSDGIAESVVPGNIFHAFDSHYRIAYSHNPYVNRFLHQFAGDLTDHVPYEQLLLTSNGLIQSLFERDDDIANISWARTMSRDEGFGYSLFLTHLYEQLKNQKVAAYRPLFPRGLPTVNTDNYFLLEQAVDWLGEELNRIPQPFLGYFHFMPPHDPYTTHRDFVGRFADDQFRYPAKPTDIFASERPAEFMLGKRREYDEFLLYLDREFGRFFDRLQSTGMLDNSWLVFTSDHGEMFERGIQGHITPSMYQPVIRIPLLIFPPGGQTRIDVHDVTSAVDVLPTLLHIAGQKGAAWSEGVVMPPFAPTAPDPGRSVYALQAYHNDPRSPLKQSTGMLVKGRYKLVYFSGYHKELGGPGELIQLYDIQADPEELQDLSDSRTAIKEELLGELRARMLAADKPG